MVKLAAQEVCKFFDCPHRAQCYGADDDRASDFICEIYGIDLNTCLIQNPSCQTCE